MHLSSRSDIEAPIDFVYAALTDFEGWERAAMRRGADVSRTDSLRGIAVGMAWTVRFPFRGKERVADIRLAALEPQAKLDFKGSGKMLEGDMSIELLTLSPNRTRIVVHLGARPLTLGMRLLLQSAKLARSRVQSRFNSRLRHFAAEIEQRYTASGKR